MQLTTTLCAALLGAALAPAALTGDTCSASQAYTAEGSDIVATAVEAGSFKTLAAALEAADLIGALQGKGPFTVFAPTDEAFAKLPAGTVESLLRPENKEKLVAILKLHVIEGRAFAAQVVGLDEVAPLAGGPLMVRAEGGTLMIGGAKVLATDVQASNGVLHVIDRVLLPGQGR
ncbi:MAG TPA: fasciclin domain-containing protein [Planctomycetota bacterium]|nr:fasciclin domain-containing protein [Planctomycetota bacterium]